MSSQSYIVDSTGKLVKNDSFTQTQSNQRIPQSVKSISSNQLQGRTVTHQTRKDVEDRYTNLAKQLNFSPPISQPQARLFEIKINDLFANFTKFLNSHLFNPKLKDDVTLDQIINSTITIFIAPLKTHYRLCRTDGKLSFTTLYAPFKEAIGKFITQSSLLEQTHFLNFFQQIFFYLSISSQPDRYHSEFLILYLDAAILHMKDPLKSIEVPHETTLRKALWREDWDFIISYAESFVAYHVKTSHNLPTHPYLFAYYLIAELEKIKMIGSDFSKLTLQDLTELLNDLKSYQHVKWSDQDIEDLLTVLRGDMLIKPIPKRTDEINSYLEAITNYWMLKGGHCYFNSLFRPAHFLLAVQNYLDLLIDENKKTNPF